MKYSGSLLSVDGSVTEFNFLELRGVSCQENIQDYNNVFRLIPVIIILIILIM